jgi:hypothetical protein
MGKRKALIGAKSHCGKREYERLSLVNGLIDPTRELFESGFFFERSEALIIEIESCAGGFVVLLCQERAASRVGAPIHTF